MTKIDSLFLTTEQLKKHALCSAFNACSSYIKEYTVNLSQQSKSFSLLTLTFSSCLLQLLNKQGLHNLTMIVQVCRTPKCQNGPILCNQFFKVISNIADRKSNDVSKEP